MDFEHTLTAADVKIRTADAAYLGMVLGAGWPETPFVAEARVEFDADGQQCWTAVLATGRKIASPTEITLDDVYVYLDDVVKLDLGEDYQFEPGPGQQSAGWLFTDTVTAQRILGAHQATTVKEPDIELVVTRRYPGDANLSATAFHLWLAPLMPKEDPDEDYLIYDENEGPCDCRGCADDDFDAFTYYLNNGYSAIYAKPDLAPTRQS